MILLISVRSQSIFLIVVGLSGHALVGMDSLNVLLGPCLLWVRMGRGTRKGRHVHGLLTQLRQSCIYDPIAVTEQPASSGSLNRFCWSS